MASGQTTFAARRPPGRGGQAVSVRTNAFPVTRIPDKTFYHYDAFQNGTMLPKRKRIEAIDILQSFMHPEIFNPKCIYDGVANLYSYTELAIPAECNYAVNLNHQKPQVRPNIIDVKIMKAAAVAPRDLFAVLQGQGHTDLSLTLLQILNILVRQAAVVEYPNKGNTFYTPAGCQVHEYLEIWRGYFQSVRPTPQNMVVNIDVATGVMYASIDLIEFSMRFFKLSNARDLYRLTSNDGPFKNMKSVLHNVVVECQPTGRKCTVHTIVQKAGSYEFDKDGTHMTVAEYFYKFKNIVLRHPNAPGIKTKGGAVIPFEFCKIIGGQLYKKRLTPDQTTKVLGFSTSKPDQRMSLIAQGISVLAHDHSPFMNLAQMRVAKDAMTIKARLLDSPPILWGGPPQQQSMQVRDGAWNVVDRQLRIARRIHAWACVDFSGQTQDNVVRFIEMIERCLNQRGVAVQHRCYLMQGTGSRNISQQMLEAGKAAFQGSKVNTPTIILVILPMNAAEIRKEVKRFGDIVQGCPTQCIRADKLKRANDQYCNNVALKINCKIGGLNSVPALNHPSMQFINSRPTMIVGADVTHPGPGVQRPSVAALASSVDQFASQYVASTNIQGPRVEIIQDLKTMFMAAMQDFHGYQGTLKNDIWPHQVVFFRDGVSEGEYKTVVDTEFAALKEACLEIQKTVPQAPMPKITFVVVGKRHHTRFFPTKEMRTNKSGNCPPGLVVDSDIISPNLFDFYLQSHSGILGTSRPSHYIVLKDENNFDPDRLQSLCYALCHTYQRATRAVSIPAPVYYADIVCARADFHFEPGLGFMNEDTTTDGEFNLEQWRGGWSQINRSQRTSMYFM